MIYIIIMAFKEEQNQFRNIIKSVGPNFGIWKYNQTLRINFILFVAEVVMNGFMLQGALVGGPAEGISVAVAIAFLNCVASGLAGYYIFKKITHLEKKIKIIWGFFALIYTTFVVYLNICLGAYRSKSEEMFQKLYGSGSAGNSLSPEQSLYALSKVIKPWSGEIEFMFVGVILTFVGLFFAALSIISGFLYNDTYPGYGNVGQKVNYYRTKLENLLHYMQRYIKSFSDHNKELRYF